MSSIRSRQVCLMVLAVWGAVPVAGEEVLFEKEVRLELGSDRGQSLGSLFEAHNSKGEVVLGAGFNDVHSTYMRDNNRVLSFYFRPGESQLEVTPLGKPFGPDYNASRLLTDGSDLLAFFRFGNPVKLQELNDRNEWVETEKISPRESAGFAGLQFVDNRRMVFQPRNISLDGEEIFNATEAGMYYYNQGKFFVFRSETKELLVCDWAPSAGRLSLEGAQRFEVEGNLFVYGAYRDETLVATNIGNVYTYKDGNLKSLRQSDGKSWQAYSVLQYYDVALIGHYPTGSLYVYDGHSMTLWDPPIPKTIGASPNAREAQTLAIYGGDLYAGVWPWGEIWRLDARTKEWALAKRVYEEPPVTEAEAPFVEEMVGKPDAVNYWGQRINNLTNLGDSLYVATMNKQGKPYDPAIHDFISPEAVGQYGRVHRLWGNAQVSAQIEWKPETDLRFSVTKDRLRIFQDGALLGEAACDPADLPAPADLDFLLGKGVYGPFAGGVKEK